MTHELSRISPEFKSKLTMCLHESTKFPDFTAWKINDSQLYQWAQKEGFTDIVNSTFPVGKKRIERAPAAYKKGPSVVARKSVVRIDGKYRTFGELLDIALTYNSYVEWFKAEPLAYNACMRHEWLEAISVQFPKGKGRVWMRSPKDCIEDAKLYKTLKEWRLGSPSFYGRASRKGWLKRIKADVFSTKKATDIIDTTDKIEINNDSAVDVTADVTADVIETNTDVVADDVMGSDTATEANDAVIVIMDDESEDTQVDRVQYVPEKNLSNVFIENTVGRKLAAPLQLCRYLINISINSIEGYPSTDAWYNDNKATYHELERTKLVSIVRHKIIQQNVLNGGSFLFVRDSEILLEELKAMISDCSSFECWAELNPEANKLYSEFGLTNSIYSLF